MTEPLPSLNRRIRAIAVAALCSSVLLAVGYVSPALAACGGIAAPVSTEAELIAAIVDFNGQAGPCDYMITLSNDISLTASTTVINNANGGVSLLIDGQGFAVDGQEIDGVRPFEIAADTVVEMQDLTVTGGRTSAPSNRKGVGIQNRGALTLTSVILTNNLGRYPDFPDGFIPTGRGGAVNNNGGILTIRANSVISGNAAEFGGGLYNVDDGLLNVFDSTVNNNSSYGGGGIYNEEGVLNVASSAFTGNSGGGGAAAIETDDLAVISDSQFTGAGTIGGAPIQSGDVMTISDSAISGYDSVSVGAVVAGELLSVIDTSISNNSMGRGGGIIAFGGGTINVINSTISGNTSDDSNIGAGIHLFDDNATVSNSTLSGNDRGLQVFGSSGQITVSNSLVVNSTGDNCDIAGTLVVDDASFADDATCTGMTNDSDASAFLGPLQDNGGSTFTHALLPSNPAINAGDNAKAVDLDGNPLANDQRGTGFPRIQAGVVDVGAFEFQVGSLTITKTVIGGPLSAGDFNIGITGAFSQQTIQGDENGAVVYVEPGFYSVNEVSPQDYTVSYSPDCSGTIAAGDVRSCIVTNTHKTTLTLVKAADPEDGTSFDFTIHIDRDGGNDSTFMPTLEARPQFNTIGYVVDPGAVAITETVPGDWRLDGASCTGGSDPGSLNEQTLSVVLGLGEELVCTFYNSGEDPRLGIEKKVDDTSPETGDTITYTVVVSNSGDGDAIGAVISDTIPNGLSYVSNSATLDPPGAGTIGAAPQLVSGLTITAGTSVTLTFQATVNGGLVDGLTITNTASVTAANYVTPTTDSVTLTVDSPPVEEVTLELTLAGMAVTDFTMDPAFPDPVGVLDWQWTILNETPETLSNIYFDVILLDPPGVAVVNNADGGPAGQGARVSVPNSELGPDGQLTQGETYDQIFEIGWLQYVNFTFQVQAWGVVGGGLLDAAEPHLLNTFTVEFDTSMVDVPHSGQGENQIFLPLLQR